MSTVSKACEIDGVFAAHLGLEFIVSSYVKDPMAALLKRKSDRDTWHHMTAGQATGHNKSAHDLSPIRLLPVTPRTGTMRYVTSLLPKVNRWSQTPSRLAKAPAVRYPTAFIIESVVQC